VFQIGSAGFDAGIAGTDEGVAEYGDEQVDVGAASMQADRSSGWLLPLG